MVRRRGRADRGWTQMDANGRAFVYPTGPLPRGLPSNETRLPREKLPSVSDGVSWREEWEVLVGDLRLRKSGPRMNANGREWTQTYTEFCT